ncbi:type II toxin-antitoxin system RelE/ParE family toxin [Candidatus Tisiphia endosymbiont of Ptychoptera albimana]|uniref:type II toxin-antitoxin system RelE family toxin n=1 Tax=Candidatus Tisiphia endosymbiont of Ptychoptera albimana TaxID=3066260 RepID=UPI00312C79D4
MYNIEFTKQAMKDLHRIPQGYAVLILKKVKQLSINSHNTTLDVKKLKGVEGAYRLRLGDYRVIYEIDDKRLLINIIKIQSRGNVYG